MENKKYSLSLEDVLGKDDKELTALKKDDFETEKLGVVPFTAIEHEEYKQAKKDCMKMVPDGTGGMQPDLDDDKLMSKIIIAAVGKDDRTNFTFANKELLKKLGVATAEAAVGKLLSPGEIYRLAMKVQNLSGFGQPAKKQAEDEVKNS
jgi:hypothetical protein